MIIPERGYSFLGDEVRRSEQFDRAEVESALKQYEQLATTAVSSGDWNPWADQFSHDAIYVEHQYGVLRGQAAIRQWITSTMQGHALQLEFPIQWSIIDNDLVFIYVPNCYPSGDGGPAYQFISATILCYAGDGKWCYEEDIYNTVESTRVQGLYAASKKEG